MSNGCIHGLPGPESALMVRALFGLSDLAGGPDEAIGIERDGIDPRIHQERGKIGIITGRLSAYPDLDLRLVRLFDGLRDHAFDRFVPFVEQ